MSDFLREILATLLGMKCNLITFCKETIKKEFLYILS